MRIWGVAAFAAAMLIGSTALAADPEKDLLSITRGVQDGKCDLRKATALTNSKGFASLTSEQRSLAWAIIAICTPDEQVRRKAVGNATAEPKAIGLAWNLAFTLAVADKKYDDALTALEAGAKHSTSADPLSIHDEVLYQLTRELKGDAARFDRLAAALDSGGWRPEDPFDTASWLWARYAAHLLKAGQTDKARQVAQRVIDPVQLIQMSMDKTFDPIVQAQPARFEPQAAIAAMMDRQVALTRNWGKVFSVVATTSQQLRRLGRQEEALALVDELINSGKPIAHHDGQDARNWAFDERSSILLELGRSDEAVAQLTKAAGLQEAGAPNVSQMINLAGVQNEVDDHQGALKTLALAATRDASVYGKMWVAAERVCALSALDRAAEAQADLAFTASNTKENWNARVKALLCAGDVDGVAAALIGQLKSDDERGAALLQLSRFKPTKARHAFGEKMHARMETVRARPDVKAAIAEVGRARDFPIVAAGFLDLY